MRHTRLGAIVPALALVLALAANAWADCAPYISTGANDAPATGSLLGTDTRTETTTVDWSAGGSASGGVIVAKGEASGSYSKTTTRTRTYDVGHYKMDNGDVWEVDCSDYTLI